MWRRSWSIRAWLGGLVAAVALPLLLLLVWIFAAQLQRELGEARETALRIAKATAAQIHSQNESAAALLAQMAQRPAIRDFDGATCDSLFAIVDFFPQYADLLFYDRGGALRCSAMPRGDDALVSRAAQEEIAAALRRGELQRGRPLIRHIRGQWISIVATPAGAGTLVLLQSLDLLRPETPPNAVVTILDADGTVLARSIDAPNLVGRQVGNAEVARIALREREGVAEARGLDGVSRQYGFTYLPHLRWTIYVGLPTAAVMQPVRQTILVGAVGGVLIVVVIAVVAILLSRRIERPVGTLVRAAESSTPAAGAGRGPREITRLSAAFDDMLERRSAAELRLKALSERLLEVQEQERMRVARELHDDLGQALTALKMDVIGLLEKSRHSPDAAPMVERILRTIDATVTAVQRISSELRPSVLDDLGLFAAIESEAQLFEERTGIECEVSLPAGGPEVEKAAATAIYRIVQEALTNVARHSNAARVEIRVRERADELYLEIRDDGRGIEPAQVADAASLGLAGIRERAGILGGTALIEGVVGRGTIVSIRLPRGARTGSEP